MPAAGLGATPPPAPDSCVGAGADGNAPMTEAELEKLFLSLA
jgi:hypothetical protein